MQSLAAPSGATPRWQGLTPPEVSVWTPSWGRVTIRCPSQYPSLCPSCSPRTWTWQAEGEAAHCTPWQDALTGWVGAGRSPDDLGGVILGFHCICGHTKVPSTTTTSHAFPRLQFRLTPLLQNSLLFVHGCLMWSMILFLFKWQVLVNPL